MTMNVLHRGINEAHRDRKKRANPDKCNQLMFSEQKQQQQQHLFRWALCYFVWSAECILLFQ